jgi:hypothetical protein
MLRDAMRLFPGEYVSGGAHDAVWLVPGHEVRVARPGVDEYVVDAVRCEVNYVTRQVYVRDAESAMLVVSAVARATVTGLPAGRRWTRGDDPRALPVFYVGRTHDVEAIPERLVLQDGQSLCEMTTRSAARMFKQRHARPLRTLPAWEAAVGGGERIPWRGVFASMSSRVADCRWGDLHWRLVAGALPLNARIHRDRPQVLARCARCGADMETDMHLVWDCPSSQRVWALLGETASEYAGCRVEVSLRLAVTGLAERTRSWRRLRPEVKSVVQALVSAARWAIWTQRCRADAEDARETHAETKNRWKSLLADWITVQFAVSQRRLDVDKFRRSWGNRSVLCRVSRDGRLLLP